MTIEAPARLRQKTSELHQKKTEAKTANTIPEIKKTILLFFFKKSTILPDMSVKCFLLIE